MKKLCWVLILLVCQCREKYEINSGITDNGYLVVEGFIKYGDETTIQLSRTTKLAERSVVPEKHAVILVEGQDSSVFTLIEKDSGQYTGGVLLLNANTGYRLRIKTQNNKEYVSDFRKVIITPAIDSLSWERKNGVDISFYSHDPENNTHYYKWDYDEAWEYHSKFRTNAYFAFDIFPDGTKVYTGIHYFFPATRLNNDSLYYCWGSRFSTVINIGTTINLSKDVVYRPFMHYEEKAWELSYLYSVNVKQYGLGKDAYEFFVKMKKNTESLGSIFDAQPSELKGNIQCITDPGEPVIGFVEACSVAARRLFINNKDLPGWDYDPGCSNPAVIADAAPINAVGPPDSIFGFEPQNINCVDCRLRGSPIKPSYWPQ